MASRYWIKLYHELLDDPKIGRLTDSQFRLAINLFLLAGDYDRKGFLPAVDDIRWRLRSPEHFDDDLQVLIEMGILENQEDGLIVSKFADRQCAMTAEERSRRRHERARRTGCYTHESFPISARNAHDSCIDVDIDKDEELNRDKERDEDEDHNSHALARSSRVNPSDPLIKCFIEQSGLPLNTGGKKKWAQAFHKLKSAGVLEEDLTTALVECRAKNLVIASLASIVNPAIIAMSRRTAAPSDPSPDYRRYLKGEFGDFGIS